VTDGERLLAAIRREPGDDAARLALSDWLEENGRTEQAELLRLHVRQRAGVGSLDELRRVEELLASGVRPVVPEVVNSLGMRLALLPPGRFYMGAEAEDYDGWSDQGPRHEVTIAGAFYLGVFLVTQAEYERLTDLDPSHFSGHNEAAPPSFGMDTSAFPVESVSWQAARDFAKRLSDLPEERAAGRVYRLPTEAEWEYACRGGAGHYRKYHYGDELTSLWANFDGNHADGTEPGPFLGRTTAVGSYAPNAWGLYDMHGNVCEWCQDNYGPRTYGEGAPRESPKGPRRGTGRVVRGGSFSGLALGCRSAFRNSRAPGHEERYFGFRLAMNHRRPHKSS
jgi:uncharacterized protein (TIGR02996 family)